jgi:hypothetical protein
MAPDTLRGDAIRLARSAGGAVARIPASCVPLVPGWPEPDGTGFENVPEYAMPHAIIVDSSGRRFCDDSYWPSIVPRVVDPDHPHRPFFLICDDQHRRKYGLRLRLLGTGIGSTGVRIDGDGHVLTDSGLAVPGLYAVGSCAAATTFGSGYNSGFALGRGLTLAYLVAREVGRQAEERGRAFTRGRGRRD